MKDSTVNADCNALNDNSLFGSQIPERNIPSMASVALRKKNAQTEASESLRIVQSK